MTNTFLYQAILTTPLGDMLGIADEQGLRLLQFADHRDVQHQIGRICPPGRPVHQETNEILQRTQEYLDRYFTDPQAPCTLPIKPIGTPFQHRVWRQLRQINSHTPLSYAQVARALDKPLAYRAVARACGANPLLIIIPCHRVLRANGALGGFSAGLDRKIALLAHQTI